VPQEGTALRQLLLPHPVGQEAEVPQPVEPVWRDVEHQPPQELDGLQCQGAQAVAMGIVFVAEGDRAVFQGDEPVVGGGAVGARRAAPRRGGRGDANTATVSRCRHGGGARRYGSARGLPHDGRDGGRARALRAPWGARGEAPGGGAAGAATGRQEARQGEPDGLLPRSTDVGSPGTTVGLVGRRTVTHRVARVLLPPPPCRHAGTGDSMSAPLAGEGLGGAPRRAGDLPPTPCCRRPGAGWHRTCTRSVQR
jgi:hypothetical protein